MSATAAISLSKILIADDSRLNRMLWTTLFSDWNQDLVIDEANDGHELVEMVRANRYDVVITDIMMPILTGIEAVQIIREFNPVVPIIGISGSVSDAELASCIDAGMNLHLKKPVDFARLISEIGSLLQKEMGLEPEEQLVGSYARLKKVSKSDEHFGELIESLNLEISDYIARVGEVSDLAQHVHLLVNKLLYVNDSELIRIAKSMEKSVKTGMNYEKDLALLKNSWKEFHATQNSEA